MTSAKDIKNIWEAYVSVYEQTPAPAIQPTPTPIKSIEKTVQAKPTPKVTDPSSGVDIDPLGRWKGSIIKDPKVLEKEKVNRKPEERSGADPNLPAGEANPNKKKRDEFDTSKMSKEVSKTSQLSDAQERKELKYLLKSYKSGQMGTGKDVDKSIRDLEIKLYGLPISGV